MKYYLTKQILKNMCVYCYDKVKNFIANFNDNLNKKINSELFTSNLIIVYKPIKKKNKLVFFYKS